MIMLALPLRGFDGDDSESGERDSERFLLTGTESDMFTCDSELVSPWAVLERKLVTGERQNSRKHIQFDFTSRPAFFVFFF